MEPKPTSGVLRRIRPLPGSYRYYPYATGTPSGNKHVREEVVQLGVDLSVSLAKSMFLLCDDIHTMLWFCFKLLKYTLPPSDPVSERLLRVVHYVYSKDIKPKNRACPDGGNSVQWELVRTTWKDFTDGIIILSRLVLRLRKKDCYFDDRLLSSAIAKYKQQVLKKLEDKLKSAKDVSELNGFERETVASNVSDLWKSLFDEEAGESTPEVARSRILSDLFQPISGHSCHCEIPTLPVTYPYILGVEFAKQKLREEVVQLGVELSLYVAESMFLLSDEIRSVFQFCSKLWRDLKRTNKVGHPAGERLLRVIHHVYSRYIKPKNGVYHIGGKSVQWELVKTTWEDLDAGFREMHSLISILEVDDGSCTDGREFTSRIEEALNKVEEKLRCAKDVSEANGFAREAMKSNILDMWQFLFDREKEEVAWTRKVRREEILSDLFPHLGEEDEEEAKQY
ncbi:hypothetical protein ISN44_As11g008990 [Arabidopsis suecica]|uniref:Uncharacterized protein n=1 Tax=Arabidopsis suecica TaxID=45249 RepID=A0A8T1Z6R1_ARASU|nr:hypothetical protein ISN44_As11g008990 [Arabidopsis suecica]